MKTFALCLLLILVTVISSAAYATSNDDLLSAVQSGKTAKVLAILKANPSLLNASLNEYGKTPLMVAAQKGHVNLLEKLIAKHAKLEIKDGDARTALHLAVHDGKAECVRVLIRHGAKVNVKDDCLHTPLIDCDKLPIARMLVAAGADVNAKDNCKMTALHWAACLDYIEIAEYLVAHGAKVNVREDDGHTPLFFATDSSKLVKFLLERGASAKEADKSGWSLLHQACSPTDIPSVSSPTQVSWSRGSAAREAESKEVVRLLVSHGADVNGIAKDWGTPLHVAAFYGCAEIARQLIDCGARVDIKDEQGKTALQVAAEQNYAEVVELLSKLSN